MKEIRSLGNKIKYLSNKKSITNEEIASLLGQPVTDINMCLAGRKILSYEQLDLIADKLQVEVGELFEEAPYGNYTYAMDCMNEFSNLDNREDIIDIIYDFLDVYDSLNS